jgi:hypothetical protein
MPFSRLRYVIGEGDPQETPSLFPYYTPAVFKNYVKRPIRAKIAVKTNGEVKT